MLAMPWSAGLKVHDGHLYTIGHRLVDSGPVFSGRWVHWAVGALAITQPVLNLLDLKFSALGRQMYKTGTSSALWLTGARNSNRGREVLPRLG